MSCGRGIPSPPTSPQNGSRMDNVTNWLTRVPFNQAQADLAILNSTLGSNLSGFNSSPGGRGGCGGGASSPSSRNNDEQSGRSSSLCRRCEAEIAAAENNGGLEGVNSLSLNSSNGPCSRHQSPRQIRPPVFNPSPISERQPCAGSEWASNPESSPVSIPQPNYPVYISTQWGADVNGAYYQTRGQGLGSVGAQSFNSAMSSSRASRPTTRMGQNVAANFSPQGTSSSAGQAGCCPSCGERPNINAQLNYTPPPLNNNWNPPHVSTPLGGNLDMGSR